MIADKGYSHARIQGGLFGDHLRLGSNRCGAALVRAAA
jgi:hypothetical protein